MQKTEKREINHLVLPMKIEDPNKTHSPEKLRQFATLHLSKQLIF
jgi:hypothetical protein